MLDESDDEVAACFQEFCEESSLGGFKYLLEQYGPFARRLSWLVVLLVFSGLTLYQLFVQIQGYIENPLVVNQEIDFADSLDFPTIVICNTMPYRVSAVRPVAAMHQALFNLYSKPTFNVSAANKFVDTLSSVKDVGDYFERVATQKSDLILNCTFDGDPDLCNVATDINAVMTPYGMCYAFNSAAFNNDSRNVTNSGPMHGFEVVLNAETYEAMQGPYTNFGVKTHFLEGVTCDSRSLKYFNFYKRQVCIMEKAIDEVIKNCSCIPHIVDRGMWPHQLNLPSCDLGRYYVCGLPIINSLTYVSEEACPKECNNYDYTPSISLATVAWERLQTYTLINVTAVQDNLLKARDITNRYVPTNNKSMEALFNQIQSATKDVYELVDYINNASQYEFPPMPAIAVPPSYFSTDVSDKIIHTYTPRLKSDVENMFQNLNSSINALSNLAQNDTWIGYLNLKDVDDELEEQLFALDNLFSVTEGSVYLSFIIQWSKTLDSLTVASSSKSENQDSDKNAKTGDIMSTFNASFYTATGKTALSNNGTVLLNGMVTALRNLKLNYQSDQNCWNIRIPQPFIANAAGPIDTENATIVNANQTLTISYPDGPPRLFDMITCLLVNFAQIDVLNNLASNLISTVSIFRSSDLNAHNQQRRCNQFLCEFLGVRSDGKSCVISLNSWVDALKLSVKWASTAFDLCYAKGEEAVEKLDTFVLMLTRDILPEFIGQVSNVTQLIDNVAKIQATLDTSIFADTSFPETDNEITSYLDRNSTYKTLSEFVVDTLYPFATNTFSFNMGSALQTLMKLSHELDIAEERMNNVYDRNSKETSPIFAILTKYMLGWRNETVVHENAEAILNCIDELQNTTLSAIKRIPNVQDNYTKNVTIWHLHARLFLKDLNIDQSFFRNNFLVINVCFDEISVQETSQSSAYNFWSLMSDIGGASGLWLGFSCICLVEFVDLAIRRCCIGAYKYSMNRRRKQFRKKLPIRVDKAVQTDPRIRKTVKL